LNYLNARRDEAHKMHGIIRAIENSITFKNSKGKRKFVAPMPDFRNKAKNHIESILVSFKAKNKVVTWNVNKTQKKGEEKYNVKRQLTPRGQLHKETIYGKAKILNPKPVKLSSNFLYDQVELIVNRKQK